VCDKELCVCVTARVEEEKEEEERTGYRIKNKTRTLRDIFLFCTLATSKSSKRKQFCETSFES